MNVLVQGAVNALGYLENGVYQREPDCFETIRDIIRYLRNDTPEFSARIECGTHNVIEHDLVPLVKSENLSEEMFDITIRLLVNLCQPAIASMHGKAPEDRDQWKIYWELEENLRRAKSAFIDTDFFKVLKRNMDNYFLETDFDDRDENSRLIMERIVLLLRYIFSISQDNIENKRTAVEDNCNDKVILAFLNSGLDKTLMHISNQPKEKEFHVTILNIFALLIKEHEPENIALSSSSEIGLEEKKRTDEDFKKILENHAVKESQRRKSFHRFGGSYVVKGMKAMSSERDMVVFKPVQNMSQINFGDERKAKKRIARNRRPFEVQQKTHNSSEEVREKLKSMLICLVDTCFNRLMKSSRQIVFEQKHVLQRTSQANYFFMVSFILRFVRLSKIPLDRVSQCTGVEAFHENNVQLIEYVENACTLKGVEAKSYGLKAQFALGAFNELVLLHQYAFEKGTESEKEMARKALDHILKVEEYRDLCAGLIKKFSPAVLSTNFLRELALTTHNYLKLLEKFVKSGTLRKVTKKTKLKKTSKKARKQLFDEDNRAQFDTISQENLEKLWEETKENVENVIRGVVAEIEDMNPLNLSLEVDKDDEQKFAMLSIQRSLRAKCFPAAIGLYRASRKIWPSDGIFGKDGMTKDEEIEELKQICMMDLKDVAKMLKEKEDEANARLERVNDVEDFDEMNDESEEEKEDDVPCWKVQEVEFDFAMYVGKFAKVEVLKWYVFLINDFQKNSTDLNHAIVKMLHRIAFDLKLTTRLYQLSLFQVFLNVSVHFQNIPKEKHKSSPFYEIYEFGFHLLKRFFKKLDEFGSDLLVEVLFWKSAKEVYEIENGYGSYDKAKDSDNKVWNEELETEVRNLYDEYKSQDERPEGIDVLDFIEHNLSRARNRRQIYRKLKEFGLDLMGSKMGKEDGGIETNFPLEEMRTIHEEWKHLENNEVDLVEMIRDKLAESFGPVSRKKVIKQLNFADILYQKPKKERSLPKWDEELVKELEQLKAQYEEIQDAENIMGVDIVRYSIKRLSVKKPSSQIVRYLVSMGAKVPEEDTVETKNKNKRMKKKDAFLNDESDEEEREEEVEEGIDKDTDEDDEENMEHINHLIKKKKKVVIDSDDENEVDNENQGSTSVEISVKVQKDKDESPKKTTVSLMDRIKNRKRKFAQLFDDSESDEDDSQNSTKKGEATNINLAEEIDFVTFGTFGLEEKKGADNEDDDDPFTKVMKYKKRILMDDEDDEDEEVDDLK